MIIVVYNCDISYRWNIC